MTGQVGPVGRVSALIVSIVRQPPQALQRPEGRTCPVIARGNGPGELT